MSNFPMSVGEAVTLLDHKYPDWADKINTDILSFPSINTCIIGQLYDNRWAYGKERLFGVSWGVPSETLKVFCDNIYLELWKVAINSRKRKVVGMTLEQALAAMREGKWVRRDSWENKNYKIIIKDGKVINNSNFVVDYDFRGADLVATDWLVVDDKKKAIDIPIGAEFTTGISMYRRIEHWNMENVTNVILAEFLLDNKHSGYRIFKGDELVTPLQ